MTTARQSRGLENDKFENSKMRELTGLPLRHAVHAITACGTSGASR